MPTLDDQAISQESVQPKRKPRPRQRKAAAAKTRSPRVRTTEPTHPRRPVEPATARAAKLAANLVDFERAAFNNAMKVMVVMAQRSEKVLQSRLNRSNWLPKEGKKLVDEWLRTMKKSREDYHRTIDKSFDLVSEYLRGLSAGRSREK